MKRDFFAKIIKQIIFVLLVLFLLALIGSALPFSGNYRLFAVLSGSMAPAIQTGSLAMVVPRGDYQNGDVITFADPAQKGLPVTHRIVEIQTDGDKNFYITKGDANNAPDFARITKSEIFGKAVFWLPLAGYVLTFLKTRIGFILFVMLPLFALVIFEIFTKQSKKIDPAIGQQK